MLQILRRVFDFSDWAVNHPKDPPPADMMDASFDAQNQKINEIIEFVLQIRRADGVIANETVSIDSLSPHLRAWIDEKLYSASQKALEIAAKSAETALKASAAAESAAGEAKSGAGTANVVLEKVVEAREGAYARVNVLLGQAKAVEEQLKRAIAGLEEGTGSYESAAGYSEAWARASRNWAEFMPETIPEESLILMDVSGDHWSAKWWANYADNAFGRLTDLYLGALPAPPLTDPNGNPLTIGAIYYNTTANQPYIWNGSAWVPMWAPQRSLMATLWYVATAGQTVFPTNVVDIYGNTYTLSDLNGIDVHVDGKRLTIDRGQPVPGEYTVDYPSTTITLETGAAAGKVVAIDILAGLLDLASMAPSAWKLDSLTFDGTSGIYTLTAPPGTPPLTIGRSEELVVSHDNVILEPGVDYIVSDGNQIVFANPPAVVTDDWMVWYQPATPSTNVSWDDIDGKPSTYPPSVHSHNEYAIITHGIGAPSAGIGLEGDYYYDDQADVMFGPKGTDIPWPIMLRGFVDAPPDGKQYSRKNSAWDEIVIPPVIIASDAPADGNQYARRNNAWDQVIINTSVPTHVGIDPPAVPKPGQLWYETDSGDTFIWYDDGTSAQWVQVNVTADDTGLYVAKSGDTMTGKLVLPASAAAGAGFGLGSGVAPTTPVDGDIWVTSSGLGVRFNGTSYSAAMLNGSSTFTGTKTFSATPIMATPDATKASFRVPHGVAPTTPVNGDVWSTTSGWYVRTNGVTQQLLTDAPIDGSQYVRQDGAWSPVDVPPGTIMQDTPPASPDPGQMWWETDTGRLFIWYVDATGPGQWVQINAPVEPIGEPPAKTADSFNRIVNGNFAISQENGNTGGMTTAFWLADQWVSTMAGAGTATYSRVQATPPGSYPDGGYHAKILVGTADASLTGGDILSLRQPIEGLNTGDLRWGWAGGADPVVLRFTFYTSVGGTFAFSLRNNATDTSYVELFTAPIGWSEQVFAIPAPPVGTIWAIDSTTGIHVNISLAVGPTYVGIKGWQSGNFLGAPGMTNGWATAGHDVRIGAVGLYKDPNSTGVAPPWSDPDFATELVRCQRYWESSYNTGTSPGALTSVGAAYFQRHQGTSADFSSPFFKATKRTTPTCGVYSPVTGTNGVVRDTSGGVDVAATIATQGMGNCTVQYTLATAGRPVSYQWVANARIP